MLDSLGDRMKEYEGTAVPKRMPLLPLFVRLDGKAFHSFTKGLNRPFDIGFNKLMIETTKHLMDVSGADIAHTCSDEITLCWNMDSYDREIFMGGKPFKLVSVLSSYATLFFHKNKPKYLPSKVDVDAVFDCRAWTVPSLDEAANVFVWREQDAIRNSIQKVGILILTTDI